MPAATCPSCVAQVTLSTRIHVGQHVKCGTCGEELEIIWLDPVELDFPLDDEEDYADLDEDFDDED